VNLALRYVRERFHPLYYLRKLSIGRRAVAVIDNPVWLTIPGVRFQVRGRRVTHGISYASDGAQESTATAFVLACVEQLTICCFWDVGANFGYYTWLLKSASPEMKAVLFEPFAPNVQLIRETLQRHAFRDVELVFAGVSDHSGSGVLKTNPVSGHTSSLEGEVTFEERHWGVKSGLATVPLISLDEQRALRGPVDLIKIDVEGHESAVLRGAKNTIALDQPILFVECGHPGQACLQPLLSLGYQLVDVDRLSLDLHQGSTNFFCFPERFQSKILALLDAAKSALAQA